MNASQNLSMSPNTFRRILTAHGRSTTPGLFEVSTQYNPDEILREIIEKKRKQNSEEESGEDGGKESEQNNTHVLDSEHIVANYMVDNLWPPKDSVVNPPLSKIKSTVPEAATSYSFYRRPFKVKGKEAWEFAMRDLGSIDTLLNRYGYVTKDMRRDLSPEAKQNSIDKEKKNN